MLTDVAIALPSSSILTILTCLLCETGKLLDDTNWCPAGSVWQQGPPGIDECDDLGFQTQLTAGFVRTLGRIAYCESCIARSFASDDCIRKQGVPQSRVLG